MPNQLLTHLFGSVESEEEKNFEVAVDTRPSLYYITRTKLSGVVLH